MWATDASYFRVVGWGYYYLSPCSLFSNRHEKLRYSWAVDLDTTR